MHRTNLKRKEWKKKKREEVALDLYFIISCRKKKRRPGEKVLLEMQMPLSTINDVQRPEKVHKR